VHTIDCDYMEKLKYSKVLVISDNPFLIKAFHEIITGYSDVTVDYTCTGSNTALLNETTLPVKIKPVDVKAEHNDIAKKYDLILSLHCKQLFPAQLVAKVKCINVHPGYNPNNRGWFPQVFSILNKLPVGATIHEIDEQLDHGAIIAQRQVEMNSWDTSSDIYNRVQQAEVDLLKENMAAILQGTYSTTKPEEEGNVNLKKDFNELCKLDLNKEMPLGSAIDLLRALTHDKYANSYFVDPKTGSKVYVKISLEREKQK
jgi:methionyl-tRNA formyltransferase